MSETVGVEILRVRGVTSHPSQLIPGGTDNWVWVPTQPFTCPVTLHRLQELLPGPQFLMSVGVVTAPPQRVVVRFSLANPRRVLGAVFAM